MAEDILAKFARRDGSRRGGREKAPSGKDVYCAFESKDKLVALDIRLANGVGRNPSYSYLMDVIYGHKHYSGFVLVYSFMAVTVKGRNLLSLVQSLKLRTTDFIQEWSAEFDPPPEGEPIITSIEIVAGKGADATGLE